MAENSVDEVHKPLVVPVPFTFWRIIILVMVTILHISSSLFTIFVVYNYFIAEKYFYLVWTVATELIATMIVSLISIAMYINDSKNGSINKHSLLRIIFCIIGLVIHPATLIRRLDLLWYALKTVTASKRNVQQREKYSRKFLNESSDLSLLEVFTCYLNSAPLQVLQIAMFFEDYINGVSVVMAWQLMLIISCFTEMAFIMTNYSKCIRFDQDDKRNISFLGISVVFFRHLNFTACRIMTLSGLALLSPLWTSLAAICHWFAMTIWIALSNQTSFCGNKPVLEFFFYGAVGVIYIFNFVSLKDVPTRKAYSIFYCVCFFETVIATILWAFQSKFSFEYWFNYIFVITPLMTFAFAIILTIIYYVLLHPNVL